MCEIKTRICIKCNEEKDISEYSRLYYVNKKGAVTYRASCKKCINQYRRAWSKRRPDLISQHQRRWRLKYPEKAKANWSNSDKQKKKHRLLLSDSYIKTLIRDSINRYTDAHIGHHDISQEFVELKRKELILKHKIESYGKEKAPN